MDMNTYYIHGDNIISSKVQAASYEGAAAAYGFHGQITVEGKGYFVTFNVDEHGINELDRKQK